MKSVIIIGNGGGWRNLGVSALGQRAKGLGQRLAYPAIRGRLGRGHFWGELQQGSGMALHRDSFGYRKLDVYRRANDFFRPAYVLGKRIKRNDGFIRSQFLRAALSIKLNIAEGSGEIRPKEKGRLYRIARRSADECSALLDDIEF